MSHVLHDAVQPPTFTRRRVLQGVAGLALASSPAVAMRPAFAASSPTPEAESGSVLDALAGMLALIPGSVANAAVSQGVLFNHGDLKAQFEALGIDRSKDGWMDDAPLGLIMIPLALGSPVFQYAMTEELVEAIGFHPFDVDRSLETGVPPNALSLLQGTFDRRQVEGAWEAAGYKAVELDDGPAMWSKGEDGELDLQDPVAKIGAGAFNNLLLLPDDRTLVIARMGATVRAVAKQAQAGASGSMRELPQVETVVRSLLPTTVSSIVLGPSMLLPSMQNPTNPAEGGTPEVAIPGTSGDGPEMPTALLAAFGIEVGVVLTEPGATPAASPETGEVPMAQARLAMASTEDAERAVEIASERWETLASLRYNLPYSEIMTLLDAEVSAEIPTVAAFHFDQRGVGNIWQRVALTPDLLPFAPGSI